MRNPIGLPNPRSGVLFCVLSVALNAVRIELTEMDGDIFLVVILFKGGSAENADTALRKNH